MQQMRRSNRLHGTLRHQSLHHDDNPAEILQKRTHQIQTQKFVTVVRLHIKRKSKIVTGIEVNVLDFPVQENGA
jgi:hypothetical protein